MNNSMVKWLLPVIFTLWLFFVLATFFMVQKPFTAVQALAAGRAILDLAAAGWVSLVGLGLGSWLLSYLWPEEPLSLETLLLSTGLGLGLLGLLSLALGLMGLLSPGVAYGVTIGLSLLLLWRFWRQRPQWRPGPSDLPNG